MPYTQVSISGYNSSPPPDDGSTGASNQVSWAGIKTKLADPLKTAIETMNTNIVSMDGHMMEAGALQLFQQTAAPTTWTKQTTHNDKALRVVSGTASSGGTTAFSSVLTSRTILQANLPNVNFTVTASGNAVNATAKETRTDVSTGGSASVLTNANTDDVVVNVTGTAASGGSGTAMDFAIQYVDLIIASKDAA